MAGGQDIIRQLTERIVQYLDQPAEERKQRAQVKTKEPWPTRWFGMMPTAFKLWYKQRKGK